MTAKLGNEPFDSKDWVFEMKWDGYRALANVQNHQVHLYSRNFNSFDRTYPEIVEELSSIASEVILDGEIVVLDDRGKPSFQLLQNYQKEQKGFLVYMVFDLLYLNGKNLCSHPLIERKKTLQKLLPKGVHVRFCEYIVKNGKAFYQAVESQDLEGVIAKKMDSIYAIGKRSDDWLKIKTHLRQEVVICGFTKPKGSRKKFGSLILGVYDNGQLSYAGHAGTGFDSQKLNTIHTLLEPLVQENSPFEKIPKFKDVTWVKPQLLCEVKFAEWTDDGLMRQAVFLGLRKDKKPEEVKRETPVDSSGFETLPLLTHLDKVFWPQEGFTKGDLLNYYKAVSPYMLPYLIDRPETLHRFPNGIKEASFYQKNVEDFPNWLKTHIVQHEEKSIRYILINDLNSLLYVVNLGCIAINPFNSRVQSLQKPDYMIFDLDPEDIAFDHVIEVARAFHSVLKELDIPSVCKTSGATGMHIYLPMEARFTYDQVKQFGLLIAQIVHRMLPDITSLERSPKKRQKKVYLDVFQNNFGQTVAAPYSVRPFPGAPVSTPLKWTEVKKGLDPVDFNINTVLKRFKRVGDLFKPVLGKGIDILPVLKNLQEIEKRCNS